MNFVLKTFDLAQCATEKADAVVVLLTADKPAGKDAVSVLAAVAMADGDLDAKPGKTLAVYRPAGIAARRLVLASVGDGSPRNIRNAVTAAMAQLKGAPVKQLVLCLAPLGKQADAAVAGAVQAVADATYSYTLTKPKAEARQLQAVTVGVHDAAAAQASFDFGKAAVAGVELAREWGNRPANHATPAMLGDAAMALTKVAVPKGGKSIACTVLGPKEVAKLGMGSFMAVAKGSEEPLRFIVLKYQGAAAKNAPVVLVGKGITFDTGGISIKPAPEMDEMKFDMCGAASVLGTFRALVELQPAINVVGLIPSCENMPDGRAVKPGDVVTSMSGQTIEILNTDAEGRLILCDALSYAERFKPRAVVDIATLTGACVIALGAVRSGLFSSDDVLAASLGAAGDAALDPCWRMPLDEEYAEALKSNFADVANVGGRAGGAITAAKFLQRFAGSFPWAHLDIAGTAWKSGLAKGSTGRPVSLLLRYVLDQAGAKAAPSSVATKSVARSSRKAA
jgi:leucyl aminopeptidase